MTNARDQPLVGCIGGGQLARMLALAGHRLGVCVRVLDPKPDACAGLVADHVCASYDDALALPGFLHGLDALTYEFESIPVEVVEALEARIIMRPGSRSLRVCQDRLLEKEFFERVGLDVHPWRPIENEAQLGAAVGAIGTPCVLKRRRGGYDGKGQRIIEDESGALKAWEELDRAPCILEAFVPFQRELSLIGARSKNGDTAFWPLVENRHEGGILRASVAPALAVNGEVVERAHDQACVLLHELMHIGVFAIEFFELDGRLYANEAAPRVHNTGHWTIEGSHVSQFEQHLRAVLGLPLGFTEALGHCAMVNMIGQAPSLADATALEGVRAHYYAKPTRPGRKVGHLSTVQPTPADRDDALARMMILAGAGRSA